MIVVHNDHVSTPHLADSVVEHSFILTISVYI